VDARRLGQDEQYLTVRKILSEAIYLENYGESSGTANVIAGLLSTGGVGL